MEVLGPKCNGCSGTLTSEQTGEMLLSPRQLNMQFDVGPEKGNVNLCIYEVDREVWRLCIATRGTVRPLAFLSTPGSGLAAEVLQRR